MRCLPLRYISFLALMLMGATSALAEDMTAEVSRVVANLGPNTLPEDVKKLRSDPHLAVRLLVAQLTSVDAVRILAWEREAHAGAMKVVWSLRALRYLTGKEFLAETAHRFGQSATEETREQMLHHHVGPENQVSFFGVWMSRDSVYFAPRDAQERIISQWREWLRDHGDTFVPAEEQSVEAWYF